MIITTESNSTTDKQVWYFIAVKICIYFIIKFIYVNLFFYRLLILSHISLSSAKTFMHLLLRSKYLTYQFI